MSGWALHASDVYSYEKDTGRFDPHGRGEGDVTTETDWSDSMTNSHEKLEVTTETDRSDRVAVEV